MPRGSYGDRRVSQALVSGGHFGGHSPDPVVLASISNDECFGQLIRTRNVVVYVLGPGEKWDAARKAKVGLPTPTYPPGAGDKMGGKRRRNHPISSGGKAAGLVAHYSWTFFWSVVVPCPEPSNASTKDYHEATLELLVFEIPERRARRGRGAYTRALIEAILNAEDQAFPDVRVTDRTLVYAGHHEDGRDLLDWEMLEGSLLFGSGNDGQDSGLICWACNLEGANFNDFSHHFDYPYWAPEGGHLFDSSDMVRHALGGEADSAIAAWERARMHLPPMIRAQGRRWEIHHISPPNRRPGGTFEPR